jgi:hypothetical protein
LRRRAGQKASRLSTYRAADYGNYGKFFERSNTNLKKMKKLLRAPLIKTLRPASDFGFIQPCRRKLKP